MSKAKRLNEMIMMVNRRKRFNFFINYGEDAMVKSPSELVDSIKEKLNTILKQYL